MGNRVQKATKDNGVCEGGRQVAYLVDTWNVLTRDLGVECNTFHRKAQ